MPNFHFRLIYDLMPNYGAPKFSLSYILYYLLFIIYLITDQKGPFAYRVSPGFVRALIDCRKLNLSTVCLHLRDMPWYYVYSRHPAAGLKKTDIKIKPPKYAIQSFCNLIGKDKF